MLELNQNLLFNKKQSVYACYRSVGSTLCAVYILKDSNPVISSSVCVYQTEANCMSLPDSLVWVSSSIFTDCFQMDILYLSVQQWVHDSETLQKAESTTVFLPHWNSSSYCLQFTFTVTLVVFLLIQRMQRSARTLCCCAAVIFIYWLTTAGASFQFVHVCIYWTLGHFMCE